MSQTPHHLLNTSWTLHRLSPLHHDKEFQTLLDNPTALNTYAARLRDQLTGDVLSGLQTSLGASGVAEDDTLSKTGALRSCTWEGIPRFDDTFTSENEGQGQTGILIILSYENTTYKAALLPSPDNQQNQTKTQNTRKGVTPLPLLLTRTPTPLRQTLLSFLSATFDTYPSPLRLPASFMCAGLDTYVNTFLSSGARDAAGILQDVMRDVQLTLAFSGAVAPSLRSLGVGVPKGSVGGFLRGNGAGGDDGGSFLGRLEGYLERHLAMKLDFGTGGGSGTRGDLAKQHVRVSKIACGGFVIGSEGRMKLSADLGRQGDDIGDGDDGQGSQVLSEKERLVLRASYALLLGVLRRAVAGEGQMK